MFTEIRRKDRILDNESAVRLLETGEYGFLAMAGANGFGYGIPISYVMDDESHIYYHCAPEGYKLECITQNPKVSFCVVGATRLIPGDFTTAYESAMPLERSIPICLMKSGCTLCGCWQRNIRRNTRSGVKSI